jgi:NAD(P)-dependent dehydrogenase (short-subunit alcohol dehydrogenase family)
MELMGKTVLITGAARRIGRSLAFAVIRAGGNVIIHHGHSPVEALDTQRTIESMGGNATILHSDLTDLQNISLLIDKANQIAPIFALVNNAAIFEQANWDDCNLDMWKRHLDINLTAPFFLSQAFATQLESSQEGRIINMLDWRALRPGVSHLPYTISKAGLAALTKSLAISLAPRISVNALALGAVLPPSDGSDSSGAITAVPAGRWAKLSEVEQAFLFLLTGPDYITGEIIHLDGGRHLV